MVTATTFSVFNIFCKVYLKKSDNKNIYFLTKTYVI